jgi:hypothetical protein
MVDEWLSEYVLLLGKLNKSRKYQRMSHRQSLIIAYLNYHNEQFEWEKVTTPSELFRTDFTVED